MNKFTFVFNRIYKHVLHGLITAIIVVIGMLIMKHQMPPRIVKIDLVAITNHYTQLLMKETMGLASSDTAASKRISEVIKTELEPLVNEYARTHNVVVVQAQALLDTNTPDITSQIIWQLDKRLK